MKKFNLILLSTMMVVLMGLTHCATTEQNAGINPPLDGVDVAFNDFTIDPATGGEYTLETGTKITVPANAFVNAKGEPITTPVELKYREFHDVVDIITSGIPMQFKSENGTENFESAGMFEMKGLSAGEEVFIKEDKNITVDMGSFKDGEGYAFYYFDETTNEWKETGDANVKPNLAKKAEKEKLTPLPIKPIEPTKASKGASLINLDVNYKRYPELEAFSDVMWQYAGTDPAEDPGKNGWLRNSRWANIVLKNKEDNSGVYSLSMSTGDKTFETEVIPVMNGKNLEEAKAKFKKKEQEYNEVLAIREKEEERLNNQADLLRTFEVNNFGIYNCDRFYNDPNVMTFNADFEFEERVLTSDMTIFLIPDKEPAVIQYHGDAAWGNFKLNVAKKNTIMAVLPGNKVAFCKPEINRSELDKGDGGNSDFTFKMKTVETPVQNMNNLRDLLAQQ